MVKSLSSNINIMIAQYIIEPKKTLKKWVKPYVKNVYLVNFEYVYCRDPDKMYIYKLSTSNSIMAKLILKKHPEKINWRWLSENSSDWAYKLLKNNLDKINRMCLSGNLNKRTYKLLDLDKTDLNYLSENPSKWAYKLLKNNPDKIDWDEFSASPYLFKIIKTNKYYKLFHEKFI